MTFSKTVVIVLVGALAATGGCKKKDPEKKPTAAVDQDSNKGPGPDKKPVAPPTVTPLVGEALVKAYLSGWDAWNAGDKAKFRTLYANDAVSHWPDSPNPTRTGGDTIVEKSMEFRAGFPDAKSTAQLVLVNGRTVAAVWLTTGTNTGAMKTPMGEMPATGKKIGQLLFHAATFNDANQIADEWFIMDGNTAAAQIGMSPAPGRPVMDKGADAPTIVVASGNDAEKANLGVAQKSNEDFNKHDAAALMATWADDAIESDQAAPADVIGKDKIAVGTKMFLDAFTDSKINMVTGWAAGDYVVGVSTFVGTNDGDMGPMKKTGKNIKITVAEISKIEGGKIKQLWRFFDAAAMAGQMGIMPDPGHMADPAHPADSAHPPGPGQ